MGPTSHGKARRQLFGAPSDNGIGEEVENRMRKTLEEKKDLWHFDFQHDRPLVEKEFEAVSLEEVPCFYHPRGQKKVEMKPSTSVSLPDVRVTRAAKRRLEEGKTPSTQKQTSMTNYVTFHKKPINRKVASYVTPHKLQRMDSNESSSPFRFATAEAEKRFSSVSPSPSPKKTPKKTMKTMRKSPKKTMNRRAIIQ